MELIRTFFLVTFSFIPMKKSFLLFFFFFSIGYIIGIDFGTQFIKVAYQPFNRPPDIVPDPSGKRKIANAVYFGEDMRAFGNNAEGYAKLRPKSIFMGVNELLGQGGESNIPASFQQRGYPYEFVLTERNTWSLKLLPGSGFDDIPSVSAEELSAMVLDYIVSIVEKEYGEASREVVLSVPSSFSQHQRQALLDAAQLANIHVVAMIDQTTASAVTYAMTRHDDGFKRFILYDIGSRYTECSAVEVETVHENGVSKKNVVILGKETIPIGGSDFTAVISSIIADRFEQQYREDPLQDMKVVARLRENSQKYKEILSANREVQINEPNLLAGKDIQFVLYREEFEEDSMTLFDKLLRVLQNLIERLNLNIVFKIGPIYG